MTTRTPLILAALLGLALLPSCARWHIGKNIRESCETRLGIDPSALYRVGNSELRLAREARYEADTRLVTIGPFPPAPAARHVEHTGHYREARVLDNNKILGPKAEVGERHAPGKARLVRENPLAYNRSITLNTRSMGCVAVEKQPGHTAAVIAAAPFDYLLDPALSLVSTPILWLGFGVQQAYQWISR